MKGFMTFKKIILIALFAFIASVVSAQYSVEPSSIWKQVGRSCAGCGSFFLREYKEPLPDANGVYWTYFYVWSNSYNEKGFIASTFIENINIYAIDFYGRRSEYPLVSSQYFLAHPQGEYFDGWNIIAYMYSSLPNQRYVIEFSSINDY